MKDSPLSHGTSFVWTATQWAYLDQSKARCSGRFSTEVHRDRRSRSTGAEGEVPQAPSNRSAASHEREECPLHRKARVLIEMQRLHLARQRIASPAEEFGRFLPAAPRPRHRDPDQRLFEFGERRVE